MNIKQSIFFLLLFIFLISESVFGQSPSLLLEKSDIREEPAEYNGIEGYNIFVRQKPGVESVMLTEPSGFHALRATEWNPINSNEKRNLSGVTLKDAYSRYSIVSSTPIPDRQFGRAFQLFIPSRVVYGNPLSSTGTVLMNISESSQINIRTFENKHADPNNGRFQNNQYLINDALFYYIREAREQREEIVSAIAPEDFDGIKILRRELRVKIAEPNRKFLDDMNDDELEKFLIDVFWEKDNKRGTNKIK
jgi:hypothetical protein